MGIYAIALQGLQQADTQLSQSAARVASAGGDLASGAAIDTVDLSAEVVNMTAAQELYAVNLDTMKMANEMMKQTLNLLA